jgi:dolichyl-phosphate-mannose--protein O-mannosyl transferase
MSRIAMNDIHVTFFILLTLWFYLHWKEKPNLPRALLVGLAAGAAVASKWSGIFVILPLFSDQVFTLLSQKIQQKKVAWRAFAQVSGTLLVLIPTIYLLSYGQMFLQGHDWSHFRELHQQIWWYQTNLDATHPYQSTPIQWVFDLRPVYTYTNSAGVNKIQNMYMQGNPLLFWTGIITVLWTVSTFVIWVLNWFQLTIEASRISNKKSLTTFQSKMLKLQNGNQDLSLLLFLLAAYLSPWILWTFSPRIMFFYHYCPAVPFLAMLTSYWLVKLWNAATWGKYVVGSVVGLILITFVLFYPNWTGIAMNKQWAELYFALSSWQ